MNYSTLCLFLSLIGYQLTFGQAEAITRTQLDDIFTEWNHPDTPGVAAGIVRNGKIVYLKGFGMAHLEHPTPITTKTKFQVDDLAKQFTTLAFLVLEAQGTVSWEEDIRKYIPNLPTHTRPIQLKHVLNHTTGLNDYTALKELMGIRENDLWTHERALQLIERQTVLNAAPGTEFSARTSDTESTLMVAIIEKASEMSFVEFTEKYIFNPLEMQHTTFVSDPNTLIKNSAVSYQKEEGLYKKNQVAYGNAGPTNLYTCAEDLAQWYQHFHLYELPMAPLIQKLNTPAQLDTGGFFNSSWGQLTWGRDFYHKERGIPAYWRFGLLGGYGANEFKFPDQKFISFAIGNNGQYNGSLAMQLAEPFLKNNYKRAAVVDFNTIKTVSLSATQLKSYEGNFWDGSVGAARRIYVKNDTLRYGRMGQTYENAMVPLGNHRFQWVMESDDLIYTTFHPETNTMSVILGDSDPFLFESYSPVTYTPNDLKKFIGTYYNKTLQMGYELEMIEGALKLRTLFDAPMELQPVMQHTFTNPVLGAVLFKTTQNGTPISFSTETDGIRGMVFTKI